ncbi:hypothetical protein AOQ84DRAFT_222566 [Glonium stellatum]|uniref:Uncharacterized protein n=1 Tax=Glonium stellatum TaxID=574774 RepID=A0A8E2FCY6_9PEZI|nr:hypothetical protein AOQ84DRAFT_222566 [Glonium stellatum]
MFHLDELPRNAERASHASQACSMCYASSLGPCRPLLPPPAQHGGGSGSGCGSGGCGGVVSKPQQQQQQQQHRQQTTITIDGSRRYLYGQHAPDRRSPERLLPDKCIELLELGENGRLGGMAQANRRWPESQRKGFRTSDAITAAAAG